MKPKPDDTTQGGILENKSLGAGKNPEEKTHSGAQAKGKQKENRANPEPDTSVKSEEYT